jgi:hypothetical protein
VGEPKDAPAEKTLTDGCGFINRAALLIIARSHNVQRPAAVQGRIAGAKGLWIEDPYNDDPEPKIWIRDSQRKIKYSSLDRSHRILDLVQMSHSSNVPGQHHLSMQAIMNLAWNGIPDTLFVQLMHENLDASVKPLMTWAGDMAMLQLWYAVERQGRAHATRMARHAGAFSRMLGFSGREFGTLFEDTNTPEDEQAAYEQLSQPYTGRNELSGGEHPSL